MTDKVWLIWVSQGEYSDRNEWPLHAYSGQGSAEAAVVQLSALYREIKQRFDRFLEDDADYDYARAERRTYATAPGRHFRRLYGHSPSLLSCYEMSFTCAEVEVRQAA